MYSLLFSKKADKQLSKIDNNVRMFLITWLIKNINNCENPRQHGKGLVGNKSGEWRYRIGNYRALCEIDDNKHTIIVLSIAHRKSIYTK